MVVLRVLGVVLGCYLIFGGIYSILFASSILYAAYGVMLVVGGVALFRACRPVRR